MSAGTCHPSPSGYVSEDASLGSMWVSGAAELQLSMVLDIGVLEYQSQHPRRVQLRFAIAGKNLANWI